jgi:hypothetical protein
VLVEVVVVGVVELVVVVVEEVVGGCVVVVVVEGLDVLDVVEGSVVALELSSSPPQPTSGSARSAPARSATIERRLLTNAR